MFVKGNIVKVTKMLPHFRSLKGFPKRLVTEVVYGQETYEKYIAVRNEEKDIRTIASSYATNASRREAFLYHILGPYISEEE